MPTFKLKYTWNLQQIYKIDFSYSVVENNARKIKNFVTKEQINGIYKPTILYPNGGEIIKAREIEISWFENFPTSSDGLPVSFEIFYCDNFDNASEPDYKMIATVPSGIGKYNWKIGNSIKSKNVRIAIRGVNTRGERSKFSISADSFTIEKNAPQSPIVLSPLPNSRYDSFVKFIFDDSAILNTYSQRAKYFLYFSSILADIPTSVIAQNIPVGSGPIIWDTANLPNATDYKIIIILQDDDGNRSKEVLIDNISILHDKYFYIDTMPPDAHIEINNGAEYTKNTQGFVKVFVYDETTKVHSMQLIEIDKQTTVGPPSRYTRDVTWNFSDSDGTKTLRLQCQDFAGNRILENQNEKRFRILYDAKNYTFVDIVANQDRTKLIAAVNNGVGEIYEFSPIKTLLLTIEQSITAITFYNSILYIAVNTTERKGLCYRYVGFNVETVFSLTEIDSAINSMTEYKNELYFGTMNKYFYKYSSNSITKINEFESAIKKLYTDNNILYITLQNSQKIFMFDGVSIVEVSI